MTFLHSSLLPPGSPLQKTQHGLTRRDEQRARANAEKAAERECYRRVDIRDGRRCRVCGCHVVPGSVDGRQRAEHHHLVLRSRGGDHSTANVCTLCARCHDEIHVRARMRLVGDADLREASTRRLAGIAVWRLREHGWEVTGWA